MKVEVLILEDRELIRRERRDGREARGNEEREKREDREREKRERRQFEEDGLKSISHGLVTQGCHKYIS